MSRKDTKFRKLSEKHPLNHLVGPFVAAREVQTKHNTNPTLVPDKAFGTALVIAPGMAITAIHVLEEYLRLNENYDLDAERKKKGHFTIPHTFKMFIPIFGGKVRTTLLVYNMSFSGTGDIAIMEVIAPPSFDWGSFQPYPCLKLAPPDVGERIQAIGYPGSSVVPKSNSPVQLHTWPKVSTGRVLQIHDESRDSTFMNLSLIHI